MLFDTAPDMKKSILLSTVQGTIVYPSKYKKEANYVAAGDTLTS